jgi:hypothetical protein
VFFLQLLRIKREQGMVCNRLMMINRSWEFNVYEKLYPTLSRNNVDRHEICGWALSVAEDPPVS